MNTLSINAYGSTYQEERINTMININELKDFKNQRMLKEMYVDYTLDRMDVDTLMDFVQEALSNKYYAMSHSEFIDMVEDVAPSFFDELDIIQYEQSVASFNGGNQLMINTIDMNDFGQADFDIAYAPLERFPERKYVIRTDTDEAIGVVGKDFGGVSHPEFFGPIREAWSFELGYTDAINSDDVEVDTRISRNGAWALEKVTFNNHRATIETNKHKTDTALTLYAWHGVDGLTSNNVISGAIDFFCTNGMVSGDYNKIRKKNTRHFDMNRITYEMEGIYDRFIDHTQWCQKLAQTPVSVVRLKDALENMLPKRASKNMLNSVLSEFEVRGANAWSVYSAFTQYATHDDRFGFRQTANDNTLERQFKRNEDVAKWIEHPEFLKLVAQMVIQRKRTSQDIEEILRDYVEDTYNDIKEEEERENAEIIEDFESLKEKESYGDSFE